MLIRNARQLTRCWCDIHAPARCSLTQACNRDITSVLFCKLIIVDICRQFVNSHQFVNGQVEVICWVLYTFWYWMFLILKITTQIITISCEQVTKIRNWIVLSKPTQSGLKMDNNYTQLVNFRFLWPIFTFAFADNNHS